MFATPAFAQAAGGAAASGGMSTLIQLAPILVLFVAAYFLLLRPQQVRMKKHQEMVANVKRGDTVVLADGMIGKVVRVENDEVGIEIAQGVTVKVIKSMIHDVRVKGAPSPANDSKS